MKRITVATILALMVCTLARADWQEPKDNKFSEEDLKNYIVTTNDWLGEMSQIIDSVQKSRTPEAKILALGDLDKKKQACLDRHHMTDAQFEWLSKRVMEAYSIVTVQNELFAKVADQMKEQAKANGEKLADAQKRLAIYQASSKAGTRVISDEDRKAAIDAAKEEQKSAADEVKQHADEIKTAETEAAQHDTEATSADALAKNPPADIGADDRADYIQGKKNEAQTARDAAKEIRDRLVDSKKAMQDAQQRVTAAGNKSAHPEIPMTDDEKAAVKAENDTGLAQAQQDIADCQKADDQLKQVQAQMDKSGEDMKKNAPPENVELVTKHKDEVKQIWERLMSGGAATQPANH